MTADAPGVDSAQGGSAQIRTGLVGYGYWGKKLLAALQGGQDFLPTRLHFPSLKGLPPDQRPRLPGVELTEALGTLLDDSSVEAVVLATPITCHGDGVRAALLAGKHVLVEKPLCVDPAEAGDLARLASQRGLHLQTEYTWTFSPSLCEAQRLVRDGWIGSLSHVQVRLHQLGRFRDHDVYPLLVSHALSILSLFVDLDQVTWSRLGGVSRDGAATTVMLSGRGAEALTVVIDASLDDPERDRTVLILGEEGSISYRPLGPGPSLLAVRYDRRPQSEVESVELLRRELDYDESDNIGQALAAFARVLRGDEASNLEQSVRITTLMAQLSGLETARLLEGTR